MNLRYPLRHSFSDASLRVNESPNGNVCEELALRFGRLRRIISRVYLGAVDIFPSVFSAPIRIALFRAMRFFDTFRVEFHVSRSPQPHPFENHSIPRPKQSPVRRLAFAWRVFSFVFPPPPRSTFFPSVGQTTRIADPLQKPRASCLNRGQYIGSCIIFEFELYRSNGAG